MYSFEKRWLVFDDYFNKPLTNGVFPNGIRKVLFNYYFNQPLGRLPSSITKLAFGQSFNQSISGSLTLPSCLTSLSFGSNFNQNILTLPKYLKFLNIGYYDECKFNRELNPYLYQLTNFHISNNPQKHIIVERCKINKHNRYIRNKKLIDLLLLEQ